MPANGSPRDSHRSRDRAQAARSGRLPAAAAALGGRKVLCLGQSQSAAGQGLRGHHQLGFPQFGRAVGHSRGAKSSRWHWLPGNPPDFIAEKMRRAAESRGGRVPSPQPCRHLASAALSGPPPLLRDDLAHVRTPHGQHGVRHDLAPTAVHELTNVGATDGQCVAAIASGQAAHWQGLIFRSPGNGPTPA